MRKILLLVFIVSAYHCTAQTMTWRNVFDKESYKNHLSGCAYIGLDSSFYLGTRFAFRMTTDNYALEIWSYDSLKFQGREYYFTYTVEDSGVKSRFFNKTFDIKPDTLKKLLAILPQYDLQYLSSEVSNEIDSGATYLKNYTIEYFAGQNNWFRRYFVPFYNQVPRTDSFYEFAEKIESTTNCSKKLNKFIFSLPPGACYFYGSAYYVCLKAHTIVRKKQ